MKSNLFRLLTLAVLAVFTAGIAKAGDSLVLPDDIIVKESTKSFELAISLDNASGYSDGQFDIKLPDNMMLRELIDEDGFPYYFVPTNRIPASSTVETNLLADNTYRVVFYNTRGATIKENSGEILTCTVDILDSTPGEYTISIFDQELSSSTTLTTPADISTKVAILGLVLSDTETVAKLNGDPVTIKASLIPESVSLDASQVTWTSSDNEIATVDGGNVSGVGLGEATITATYDGMTAACKVTVEPIQVESVEIPTTLSLVIGTKGALSATLLPDNATDKAVTWASADEKIATVDENGEVTAVALGTTTITVTTKDGGKTAECTITVLPVQAQSIAMSEAEMSIRLEESATLTVTFTPENTTIKTVTWTSADDAIATVDADGKVSAAGLGTTTITATTDNGKTAVCKVTVLPIEAESVSLSESTLSILIGSTAGLTATVAPANTTDKTVTWTSADESIATVDADGTVKALALGTVTITATTTNGKTATCEVTVNPIEAESVTLAQTEVSILIGSTAAVEATVAPDDTTDKTVTWTSADETVATVADGVITGVGVGTTTVTVSTVNGKTATCEVTVLPIVVENIILSETDAHVLCDNTLTIDATIVPADATYTELTWTSSDTSVATVDNGVVIGVSVGETTITATAHNGITATCKVTVDPVMAESIVMSKSQLSVRLEDTATLSVIFTPANTTDKSLTWTSADESIATVDADGVVTGVSFGITTITATTVNGKTADCKVTVSLIDAESISMSQTTLSMLIGRTAALSAIIEPANTTDKSLTWTSADESVATVDADGIVTAVGLGTTTITATTINDLSATCEVTVNPVMAESVTLSESEVSIIIGSTAAVEATVSPDDTTDKTLTWASADETIATVADGVITAVGVGTTTVTVSTVNGKTATCKVTVLPIEVESITLSETEANIICDESMTITATIAPADATYTDLSWTSSDASVATVAGGVVTAVGVGEATITATAHNGVTATCHITVDPVEAVGIEMSTPELTVYLNGTASLSVIFTPANTTDKTVTWTSADESIATVDADGKVYGVALGNTTITATTANGKTATCEVTVDYGLPIAVTLSESVMTMTIGSTAKLTATIEPENAINKSVIWVSANESVAIVDNDGNVTAVGEGSTLISAVSVNGKVGICRVTVVPNDIESISLSQTEGTLAIGETLTITATLVPENATYPELTWTSSDTSVATVDDGVVKAVSVGEATITATATNGVSATCQITVNPIEADGITMSQYEMTMLIGESAVINVTFDPESTTDKTLTWTSADESVATVDADGKVTAVGYGITAITATTVNGKTATCEVYVQAYDVESITLSESACTLEIGETLELNATITPADAVNTALTWTSADESVAIVADGVVTAVGAGTTVITVTAESGVTATCEVTVEKLTQTLTWYPETFTPSVGECIPLDAVASSGLKPTYTVTSGEDNVIIDGDMLYVVRSGSFILYVTQDGDKDYLPAAPITYIFNGLSEIDAMEAADCTISVIGNEIKTNANGEIEISIYDTAGNLIYRGTDTSIIIPVKGVYVVAIGNTVTKVLVK